MLPRFKGPTSKLGRAVLCCALALTFLLPAESALAKIESEYLAIKNDVRELRQDEKARRLRHNYEKLIRRFEKFTKAYPDAARADDAMFVTAQLWDELARMSQLKVDREQAQRAYKQLRQRYPKSNLADDALFRAAKLNLDLAKDRKGALALLEQIITMGRTKADFYPKAKALKAELQKARTAPPGAGLAPASHANALGEPTDAKAVLQRITVDNEQELIELGFTAPVKMKRGDIPKRENTPRRVFLDLSPAKLSRGLGASKWIGSAGVIRLRFAQYDPKTVRVVAELNDDREVVLGQDTHVGYSITFGFQNETNPVEKPVPHEHKHEAIAHAKPLAPLQAILERQTKKVVKEAAQAPKAEEPANKARSTAASDGLTMRRVVIDAGHGGKDPGAVGLKGTREKDLTLKIARRIRATMAKEMPDVEVIMTRDSDKFLKLKERTNKANEVEADLFISIHINASVNRRVRGVETYYLNVAHDRYAKRLSARENPMNENEISDLGFILADLMMKSNVNESIRLGKAVQQNVVSSLRQQWPDVKDLGLRHALFYVLLGAHMPAILVESSFVSNPKEEKRLRTAAYQQAIADGVVAGVRRFVNEAQAQYVPSRK